MSSPKGENQESKGQVTIVNMQDEEKRMSTRRESRKAPRHITYVNGKVRSKPGEGLDQLHASE